MRKKAGANLFSSEAGILFWPSFVDMLLTTLMCVLLVNFIQTIFNTSDLEALQIRRQQEEFISGFKKNFSAEEKQGKIAINSTLNLIRITFSDEVLFISGDHQLQPQGREVLSKVAKLFKGLNNYSFEQIQVEGHTDNVPISNSNKYPRDNWELSTGRAISVVKYLTGENQLLEKFVSANGYAEFRPVENNNTDAGKAKNRRIEILIFFATPENNKK